MTESIDSTTMAAGPEMDAEIARRVFGWVRDPEAEAQTATGSPIWIASGEEYSQNGTPDYSTDIAAAWTVVEKMREHGWHYFDLEQYRHTVGTEYEWIACIGGEHHESVDPDNHHEYFCIEAKTAPLAICRAALSALEPR